MIKDSIKKNLPAFIFNRLRDSKHKVVLFFAFYYDFKRYYYYSSSRRRDKKTKLKAEIVRGYHVIEKGLTMPFPRLGFGQERILILINNCEKYYLNFTQNDLQIDHALSVINEYKAFHESENYSLPDSLSFKIDKLLEMTGCTQRCDQLRVSKEEYFKHKNGAYPLFSNSRSSVRNYVRENNVPIEKILDSLELARNTPSACNRQPVRVYIFTDKAKIDKILDLQGGNRGFGQLTNKLLIVTSDIAVFFNSPERNEAFIDGGMYAMNVLYALHHQEIAACTLNCSHTPKKDREMRELCEIKKSEIFICMISCGIPPDHFSIACSKRNDLDQIVQINNQVFNKASIKY